MTRDVPQECLRECKAMGWTNASEVALDDLMRKRVRALVDFSGVPKGTTGLVDEVYSLPTFPHQPPHKGIMVRWDQDRSAPLRDGFGRDDDFDETVYLAVVGDDSNPCIQCGQPCVTGQGIMATERWAIHMECIPAYRRMRGLTL